MILALILGSNFLISKQVEVTQELIIDKNIDSVWEVMGNQFGEIAIWSVNFYESEAGGIEKFIGIDYSKRITITERGETIQELDVFDTANHSLEYHITKGKPSIASEAKARWYLVDEGRNKTKVVLEFNMIAKGWIGLFMSGKIKNKLTTSAIDISEELKYYVENGIPHPRIIESIEKHK